MNVEAFTPKQRALLRSRNRCELSLATFVREAWAVLEPSKPLVWGWVLDAMCANLEAVSRGEIRRLLINVPPGCMKSLLVNVFWPAWEWGPLGMPHLRYISAGYEQGLATRDLVKCRDLVKSEWYQERWPTALDGEVVEFKQDQDQKTFYANTKTGWRLAASVRAALTGHRGDRVILDDPHSVKGSESEADMAETQRWFTETLPTRLNDQDKSVMVMIMQRLSIRDLSALAIELGWDHVCLPMRFEQDHPHRWKDDPRQEGALLFPELFSEKAVADLERAMSLTGGSYAVAGQLQQRPVPRGGGMFKRANAKFVDVAPTGLDWCRGWDLAGTKGGGKRTAGVLMGTDGSRLYVQDCRAAQEDPHGVELMIVGCAHADGHEVSVSIPQDPGQAGVAQKSYFASKLQGYSVHFSPESGDKVARAVPLAAQWEAGNVYLVRGPWNDAYLSEMELFSPTTVKSGAGFSDRVDASTRAHAHLLSRREMYQGFGDPGKLTGDRKVERDFEVRFETEEQAAARAADQARREDQGENDPFTKIAGW